MRATNEERSLRLRVNALVWEAEGVLSVHLGRTDGADLPPWTPGAHLDLHLPGGLTRQYSLSGSPADHATWRISVLREPTSRGGSRAVHEALRPGDVVDVTGPRNNFPLPEGTPEYRFIAGGIGITPLLPMIETVASSGADWSLLYGGRSRSSMAFLTDLSRYGERVQVRPQDAYGLLDLDAFLGPPRENTLVYCCGPEPLLTVVEQLCSAWPHGTLHLERFAAKPYDAGADAEKAFELVLQRTERSITVPASRTILEALEDHGIEPPNSCREGICGTCETKVIDGIPDHRDSLLSPEEQSASDTMMICVGRARCPRLVLDL